MAICVWDMNDGQQGVILCSLTWPKTDSTIGPRSSSSFSFGSPASAGSSSSSSSPSPRLLGGWMGWFFFCPILGFVLLLNTATTPVSTCFLCFSAFFLIAAWTCQKTQEVRHPKPSWWLINNHQGHLANYNHNCNYNLHNGSEGHIRCD